MTVAGFSDPIKDPLSEDTALWMPNETKLPVDLDLTQARYLLDKVGDQFCLLNTQERVAKNNEHMSSGECDVSWYSIRLLAHEMKG